MCVYVCMCLCVCMYVCVGFHLGFFCWDEITNGKGISSMCKHAHASFSLHATLGSGDLMQ